MVKTRFVWAKGRGGEVLNVSYKKKNSFLLAAQPHYFEVWAVLVILPELFVSGL